MYNVICKMDLEQLGKARVLINMSADISEERKKYLLGLISIREELLKAKADIKKKLKVNEV